MKAQLYLNGKWFDEIAIPRRMPSIAVEVATSHPPLMLMRRGQLPRVDGVDCIIQFEWCGADRYIATVPGWKLQLIKEYDKRFVKQKKSAE